MLQKKKNFFMCTVLFVNIFIKEKLNKKYKTYKVSEIVILVAIYLHAPKHSIIKNTSDS